MKAVAVPSRATTHIQKIAPGPPRMRASATPTMLPVPTRQARPTAKAWKEDRERPPLAREPIMERAIGTLWRSCTPRVRIVK